MPSDTKPVALFAGRPNEAEDWRAAITAAAAEHGVDLLFEADPRTVAPESVDYLLFTPDGPVADVGRYTRLKAILSLWAGVENLLKRSDLPRDVPLARMVEPGMTEGMTSYCLTQIMRVHSGLDDMIDNSRAARWVEKSPPLPSDRSVGVLGLGVLGGDLAKTLVAIDFQVSGWSRSQKDLHLVDCYAGLEQLAEFLAQCEILVVLAPETPETRGLLNAERLAALPDGAHLINVARGPLVVEADLLAALDAGKLSGATLDVFDVEPLPEGHPYWSHPKVLITPHIASWTRVPTASEEIVRQIARSERGEPLRNLVDLARGY